MLNHVFLVQFHVTFEMDENEKITHEDIYDALGEVTNMVMGSIKSKLQDSVGNFQVSIPTIVTGQEIETSLSEVKDFFFPLCLCHNLGFRFRTFF